MDAVRSGRLFTSGVVHRRPAATPTTRHAHVLGVEQSLDTSTGSHALQLERVGQPILIPQHRTKTDPRSAGRQDGASRQRRL